MAAGQRAAGGGKKGTRDEDQATLSRLKLSIGSVQKELAAEHRAIRSFVDSDPLLRRFFESNHRVCEGLFLVRYIEKFGTGTLMMIRECRAHALPEPDFVQRSGELVTTVWRDWLTEKVLSELGLNDRQRQAVTFVRTRDRIGNLEYQQLTHAIKKTASRDLDHLVRKGVFARFGTTGRGTYYCLVRKGDIKGTIEPPGTPLEKGDIHPSPTEPQETGHPATVVNPASPQEAAPGSRIGWTERGGAMNRLDTARTPRPFGVRAPLGDSRVEPFRNPANTSRCAWEATATTRIGSETAQRAHASDGALRTSHFVLPGSHAPPRHSISDHPLRRRVAPA